MKDEEGRMGIHGTREKAIARRAWRRVFGERASVMFEFAMVTPLIVMMAAFAADFTRILRTEQQLEIAARLGADVEAHMADFHGGQDCPSKQAKGVAKRYLENVAHVAVGTTNLYMKGSANVVKNPISYAINEVANFLNGKSFDSDDLFLKILAKVLHGLINFVTFGTVAYLTEVIPHDREVKVTVAAYIPTILPKEGYEWFGWTEPGANGIGVWQCDYDLEGGKAATAWNLDLNTSKRHRVYCYMPVIDSTPMAPETYVRILKSWFDNFLAKFK